MVSNPTAITTIVLLDLAVIIAAGSLFAKVVARYGQPAVIGEIIAGILLGPTLLGRLPGHLTTHLFPLEARPFLTVLADVGLVLFMFTVGFELDRGHVRRFRSATAIVSLSSVALPFLLGGGLALLLYPANRVVHGQVIGKLPFVLFLGVAMSITAFPVLARILTGLKLHQSSLGTFVMSCAAGADVAAWAILAIVVALAADGDQVHTWLRLAEMALFIAVLAFGIRPPLKAALNRLAAKGRGSRLPLIFIIVGLLLSACVTAWLGFKPIFGAFIFGALMPKESILKVDPEVPLVAEQASQLLVPVFFVTIGLSVNLSGLSASGYLLTLLVIVVASVGKFVGAGGSAMLCGSDRRRAAAIGVLMNSRGLTELVVIQVGVSLGILSEELSSILIMMAIVTTVAATPLFKWLYKGSRPNGEKNEKQAKVPSRAAKTTRTAVKGYRALLNESW
jgi:Kef-type K+ transport system membrane component KefB